MVYTTKYVIYHGIYQKNPWYHTSAQQVKKCDIPSKSDINTMWYTMPYTMWYTSILYIMWYIRMVCTMWHTKLQCNCACATYSCTCTTVHPCDIPCHIPRYIPGCDISCDISGRYIPCVYQNDIYHPDDIYPYSKAHDGHSSYSSLATFKTCTVQSILPKGPKPWQLIWRFQQNRVLMGQLQNWTAFWLRTLCLAEMGIICKHSAHFSGRVMIT